MFKRFPVLWMAYISHLDCQGNMPWRRQKLSWHELLVVTCFSDLGICNEPGGAPHAFRTGAVFPYHAGDEVQYICNQCFTGGGSIKCLSTGKWSSVVPSCTGFVSWSLFYSELDTYSNLMSGPKPRFYCSASNVRDSEFNKVMQTFRCISPFAPKFFFKIKQFSGKIKANPHILSKFWAQGPPGVKTPLRPPLTKILDTPLGS